MTRQPSVVDPDPEDRAWETLIQEIMPAKSLERIDTVTTRVVTNVTVIGTVLTGLGLIATGLPAAGTLVRCLAATAVVTAILAVGCVLTAQILVIRTHLNTANLIEVKTWYRRQLLARAYPTRAATFLLVIALLLAGAATVTTLFGNSWNRPTLAITQTQTTDGAGTVGGSGDQNHTRITLNVETAFRGMTSADTVTLVVIVSTPTPGIILARAAITPNIDGTATRSITIDNIPPRTTLDVTANSSRHHCYAHLDLTTSDAPAATCGIDR